MDLNACLNAVDNSTTSLGDLLTSDCRPAARAASQLPMRVQMQHNVARRVTAILTTCSYLRGLLCGRLAMHPSLPQQCLRFAEYLPSKWEVEWLQEAATRQDALCSTLDQESNKSQVWLDGIAHSDLLPIQQTQKRGDRNDAVWSAFKYHNTCSAQSKFVFVPIEPAVGLLRNPFAAPCNQDNNALEVDDRSFVLLATPQLLNDFPGRKFLFDLGTGKSFQSSLLWLVDKYEERGITFDEIWAWEAEETSSHDYWKSVPDQYVAKLHFYNTFASDQTGPEAPLGMIHRTFRHGDLIAVKLDIDNEVLESSIMRKLIDIRHMIAELFFEKHFDAPEMRPYFGQVNTTFAETLLMFNEYRKLGLRLHYWP